MSRFANYIFTLLAALCGLALSITAFYPGFMSFDSALAFWLALNNQGFEMTPQIMPLIWRALLPMTPNSGGALFVLNNLCYWLALFIFAIALFHSPIARFLILLICGLLSPCLLIMAHLWTDAMLISGLSLASAFIFMSMIRQQARWLLIAIPLLIYSGLTRSNALTALLPIYTLTAYLLVKFLFSHQKIQRAPVQFFATMSITCCLLLLNFGINKILEHRFITIKMSSWAVVALWDLVAISIETNQMLLPEFTHPATTTVDALRNHFREDANTTIYRVVYDNGNPRPYTIEQRRAINHAWINAIAKHPAIYLQHRWRLTQYLFGRYRNKDSQTFAPIMYSYKDNPKLVLTDTKIQKTAIAWYEKVVRYWWFTPVAYIFVSIFLLISLWQHRRNPTGLFAMTIVISGLCYIAPLPLVAPSAELRYSAWLFFSTLLGAATLFSTRIRTANDP